MEEVKKQAKENNYNKIELNCWEFNESAMKFYERIGLKTQRRIMGLEL